MHNVQLHKGSLAPEEPYPLQDVADIRHPSLMMQKPDNSSCFKPFACFQTVSKKSQAALSVKYLIVRTAEQQDGQ